MHPEIKKFWEDANQKIGEYSSSQYQVWFINGDSDYYKQGSPPALLKKDIVCQCWLTLEGEWNKAYYINSQIYTEAEMLTIIKLKAFL